MPNERTRYYYAPFMTTDLGKPSEKDYRRLPANGSGASWRQTALSVGIEPLTCSIFNRRL
jgi:hypothetical protein